MGIFQKLFEAVSCLPQKALGSSAYHIGTADLMHVSYTSYTESTVFRVMKCKKILA